MTPLKKKYPTTDSFFQSEWFQQILEAKQLNESESYMKKFLKILIKIKNRYVQNFGFKKIIESTLMPYLMKFSHLLFVYTYVFVERHCYIQLHILECISSCLSFIFRKMQENLRSRDLKTKNKFQLQLLASSIYLAKLFLVNIQLSNF